MNINLLCIRRFGENGVVEETTTAATTVPSVVMASTPETRTEMRISERECERFTKEYITLTFHILGGTETNTGEFPHMVALGYPSEEEGVQYRFDCGASLISEQYVLTAAHCLTKAQPIIARLGKVTLWSNDDGAQAQDIQIAEIISHPDYIPSRNYHDIALIRLASTPVMDENVHPACLRSNQDDVDETIELIVTGWGVTSLERRDRSGVLLKTNLTAVSMASCNASYAQLPRNRRLPNVLNAGQICAFDPQQRNDACQVIVVCSSQFSILC